MTLAEIAKLMGLWDRPPRPLECVIRECRVDDVSFGSAEQSVELSLGPSDRLRWLDYRRGVRHYSAWGLRVEVGEDGVDGLHVVVDPNRGGYLTANYSVFSGTVRTGRGQPPLDLSSPVLERVVAELGEAKKDVDEEEIVLSYVFGEAACDLEFTLDGRLRYVCFY